MDERISELVGFLDTAQAGAVVLAGDFMLDEYLFGDAERISAEAPVPVLRARWQERRLGGAGSVAASLRGLGCPTFCVGVLGADGPGEEVRAKLVETGADVSCLLSHASVRTPLKQRLVGFAQHRRPQQLLRVDHEDPRPHSPAVLDRLKANLARVLDGAAVVAIEDYNKGLFGTGLSEWLIAEGRRRGLPVLVDPAAVKDYGRYVGAWGVTPNRFEASLASGLEIRNPADAQRAGGIIRERYGIETIFITLDSEGIYLVTAGGAEHVPTEPQEVFDSTGAGDVVLATLCFAVSGRLDPAGAAALANVAGGWEVRQSGVVPITRDQLQWEVLRRHRSHRGKVVPRAQLARELEILRRNGRRTVFTNGCFDLLHPGHVSYLEFARRQGDVLAVGVNSDASVRAIKGPSRPLIGEQDRARMLAALEAVDYVVLFDEPSVLPLIRELRPDILVKGQDYSVEGVVGHEFVQSYGGKIVLAPIERQYSTTSVIKTILARAEKEKANGG